MSFENHIRYEDQEYSPAIAKAKTENADDLVR
jgi:hypothetical protein